jgi:PAS domain S-box-containing protein
MPQPTTTQMAQEIKDLRKKLAECEARYSALYDHSGFAIVLVDPVTGKAVTYNEMEYKRLGYTQEEFEQLSFNDIAVELEPGESEKNRRLVDQVGSSLTESMHRAKDGNIVQMLISSVAVDIGGVPYHQNISMDITKLKDAEAALEKAKQELEDRVESRTAELREKTKELEDTNTALRVLLQKRDDAIADIEEKLLINTKNLVLPYIDKIKITHPSKMHLELLQVLESNLKKIVSPFLKNLTSQAADLSPSELEVASLIRDGRSTKEIASFLNLSENTIETYRNRIRNKLGLKQKKVNLRTYLSGLEDL